MALLNDASLEEIEAEIAAKESTPGPDTLETISGGATALSEGLRQGLINVGQDIELGTQEILSKVGIRSAEDVAKTKAAQQTQRLRARETGARADFPTTGEIGEGIGDVGARLAGASAALPFKAAGAAGQVARGAGIGAIMGGSRTPQGDESRLGNILFESSILGGLSAVGQVGRLRPVVDKVAAAAFKKLGINPSLSQVLKSPFARDAAQTVEQFMEQIPIFGTKVAKRARFRKIEATLNKIGREADESTTIKKFVQDRHSAAVTKFARTGSKKDKQILEEASDNLADFESKEVIARAFNNSVEGGIPNVQAFNKVINSRAVHGKLLGRAGRENREVIKALQKVTGIMSRLPKPQAGPTPAGIAGIGGAAVAGTIGGFAPQTILAGGAILKGISSMLTTKAGIGLLTKGGKSTGLSNPVMQNVMKVAIRLGVASTQKDSLPNIDEMTDPDEIDLIVQELEKQ